MRRIALTFCLLIACEGGCEDEAPPPVPSRPQPSIALTRYFPLSPGDRHRYQTGALRVASGVTAIDANGVAAIVDDAGSPVTRVRATDARVEITDPEGRALTPLLVAPLSAGAKWQFAPDATSSCEARVLRLDVDAVAAGVTLTRCVEIETSCGVGQPLEGAATRHVRTDTYCPDVGRVRMASRFEPPPADGAGPVQSEIVSWRVARGPLPPRTGDLCAGLILLPSDIIAACGAGLEVSPPFAVLEEGVCAHRMNSASGHVVVTAWREGTRAPLPPSAAEGAVPYRIDVTEGEVHFAIDGTSPPCVETGARRLAPLLRSLVSDR